MPDHGRERLSLKYQAEVRGENAFYSATRCAEKRVWQPQPWSNLLPGETKKINHYRNLHKTRRENIETLALLPLSEPL